MSAEMPTRSESGPAASKRQVIASLLYKSGLMKPVSRLRSLLKRDLRILAYHRVLSIAEPDAFDFDLELISASEVRFRKQMRLLRERYTPILFGDVIRALDTGARLPPRPVIVTFDDGYDDNYRVAFPILRELGVPATFFVSTGHIESGKPYAYDWFVHMICRSASGQLRIAELGVDCTLPAAVAQRRELAMDLLDRLKSLDAQTQEAVIATLERETDLPRSRGHADCKPMTWDQLREMQAAGMEIGSHGVWHRMLAKLPPSEMHGEVHRSKQMLDGELASAVTTISYPVGGLDAYNEAVIESAKAAGYRLGCSYICGTNSLPHSAGFQLRRLPVERHMDEAWFEAMLALPEAFTYPSRHRAD